MTLSNSKPRPCPTANPPEKNFTPREIYVSGEGLLIKVKVDDGHTPEGA